MTDSRTCRDCGATFKKSRADRTVRCQSCRRASTSHAAKDVASKSKICGCGKTVIVDGFGSATRNVCPHCGDR